MSNHKIVDSPNWLEFELEVGRVWWRSSISGSYPYNAKTKDLSKWAALQTGNWAAVVETEEKIFLISDGPRSFPILYTFDGEWLVSSDPQQLMQTMADPRLDQAAAAEFLNACFVLGDDTLISGVKNVPAASIVQLNERGSSSVSQHISLTPTTEQRLGARDALEQFHEELLSVFGRLLEVANGRQLLVPLSGGADSRLILAVLHELGAPNVHTFTYGFPEALEAKLSREVSENVGYPWHHVTFSAQDLYKRWWQPKTNAFLQDCWTGLALPHIQDWYALGDLRKNPEIADDAIILPGHTIVGNEHDDWCFNPKVDLDRERMVKILAGHHLNQQGKAKKALRVDYSRQKIEDFVTAHWPDENPATRSDVTTAFNLAERQPKYINNSMRGYEHFGFDWALPMLERGPWQIWLNAEQKLHDSARVEYKRYVQQKYTAQAGKQIDYWGVVNRLPKPMSIALDILDKLRLKDKINQLYTAHVCLNHPMGLEGFAGGLGKPQLARRLYSGASIIGVYSELFLDGKWVPQQDVLPPL